MSRSRPRSADTPRTRNECGQLASVELLPFGILVFVMGVLFFGQIWAVLDAKSAVDAASREATRAYVESSDEGAAAAAANIAANSAIQTSGRSPARATVTPTGVLTLERCARVTYEVSYQVPLVVAPLLPSWGDGFRVTASHTEIVDPYRDGLTGDGCV